MRAPCDGPDSLLFTRKHLSEPFHFLSEPFHFFRSCKRAFSLFEAVPGCRAYSHSVVENCDAGILGYKLGRLPIFTVRLYKETLAYFWTSLVSIEDCAMQNLSALSY